MPLELTTLSTKITETEQGLQIEMTLADTPETETAPTLVQFRALLDTHEIAAPFVTLQIIALEHAQKLIVAEIRRLKQRRADAH